MLRVALTGGIASGKTAVSELLAGHGAVIIDADLLAREVVAPGTAGLDQVVATFGPEVLTAAGELDRARLGRTVFADPDRRQALERIVHPAVRARAAELERGAAGDAVVVHVIPLLVETGQAEAYDLCLVVDVDPETQLKRLLERGGLDETQAKARIAAQASREERLAVADIVIDNHKDRDELATRVAAVWAQLVRAELSNRHCGLPAGNCQ